MITRCWPSLALSALLLAACSHSSGAPVTAVAVTRAWARPTPAGATNGVVYLDVESPIADLVDGAAVSADIAAGAELHETMVTGGTSPMANMPQMAGEGSMSMLPVASLPVPAHGTLAFTPGGKHILLSGLMRPLRIGDHFRITVFLRSAGEISTDVVVANEAPTG